MPKERAQQPGQSSPPVAPALTDSPTSKEKSLHRTQKKFSLASAFPLSSPNRSHHYRQQSQPPHSQQQQQPPRGAHQIPDSSNAVLTEPKQPDHRIRSSPLAIRAASANREAKIYLRKGSVFQTRKHSAPVDYRDSGVYLGDPVVDMWSTIREPEEPGSDRPAEEEDDAEEHVVLASSAPSSSKVHPKTGFRRHMESNPKSTFRSSESSKSLPAIDAILSSSDKTDMHRSTTCEREVSKEADASSESPRVDDDDQLDDQDYDQFESWDLTDRLLDPRKPSRGPGRLKPQRNAQSFSTENLIDRDDIFSTSPPDSPESSTRRCKGDGQVKASVRFDESEDAPITKQLLVKKRSSMYRRSRSLAEDEASKRELENEVAQELREAEKEAQMSTGDRLRGRINLLRKCGQSSMVQVHTETDSAVCDRKNMAAKKKRSLADPIAKKLTLTFLRRRQTGSSLTPSTGAVGGNTMNTTGYSNSNSSSTSTSSNAPPKPPSREEVRKWAVSFEHLLSHKYGVMLFRLFLQREFSEENIDFWTACEEYKKLRDAKLPAQARQIYSDFVAVQAPKEVNLDSVTRSSTMASLTNPNKRTFEQAQHRIQSLMEKDSYPRFLRSDLYLDLVRKC